MTNKQRRQELRKLIKELELLDNSITMNPMSYPDESFEKVRKLPELNTKLQENKLAEKNTIKEVLELIDKWWIDFCSKVLDDSQDEEELLKELKQKIKQMKNSHNLKVRVS